MVGSYIPLVESLESKIDEVGEMGKRPLCKVCSSVVKDKVQGKPEFILSLENCASIGCINYIRD